MVITISPAVCTTLKHLGVRHPPSAVSLTTYADAVVCQGWTTKGEDTITNAREMGPTELASLLQGLVDLSRHSPKRTQHVLAPTANIRIRRGEIEITAFLEDLPLGQRDIAV